MSKTKKATSRKSATSSGQNKPDPAFSDQERHSMIAEAAYFKAEQRDFAPGLEYQDWIEAEKDVESQLQQR